MTVAVVGGGAVGATVAGELAVRGEDVVLYERGELAAGSSGRAAGVCHAAFADRRDADLARRSLEQFGALDGTAGFHFEPCPYVWLAREGDDRRAATIREQATRMAEAGLPVERLAADALAERFPTLRTDDVAVAAVASAAVAGHADPERYVLATAGRAEDAGADLRTGTEVAVEADPPRASVDGHAREFDAVVVAAGAHTPGLLAEAGVPLPVKPYRVQALVAALAGGSSSGDGPALGEPDGGLPTCFDATGGFYFRSHAEGLLAGDGTEPVAADPARYDRTADDWFRRELRRGLGERLRGAVAIRRSWAGLCTATPDRDPLVGPVADGLYVATGWQGHGFMRAPAVGAAVAEQVLGGEGIPGFDPGRFDGDEEFAIREGMDP